MPDDPDPFLRAPDASFVLTAEERAQTFVAFDPDIAEQILRWVRPDQRESFRLTFFVKPELQINREYGIIFPSDRPELVALGHQLTQLDEDGLTIRQYESGDESDCLACVIELQDSGRAIDPRLRPGAEMASEYLEQMHARCRDCSGAIFVAEESGEIIGLAMVLARVPYQSLDEPPGDYALIAELVVRDGYRNRGIGTGLLQVSEQYARSAGANELRIGVLSQNQAARDLYLHQGFVPYSEMLAKPLIS